MFLAVSILGLMIALPSGGYLMVNQYRDNQSKDPLEGLGSGLNMEMNRSEPPKSLGSGPYEEMNSSLGYWGYGLIAFCLVNVMISGFFGRKIYKKVQEKELKRTIDLMLAERQAADGSVAVNLQHDSPLPPVMSGITTCVWCLEEIKVGARVCKHCGRDPHGDSS